MEDLKIEADGLKKNQKPTKMTQIKEHSEYREEKAEDRSPEENKKIPRRK